MGPGSDGPMGGMGGMEPHHMNGSLGECLGMLAELPPACFHHRGSRQLQPVLKAELLAGKQVWGVWGRGAWGLLLHAQ